MCQAAPIGMFVRNHLMITPAVPLARALDTPESTLDRCEGIERVFDEYAICTISCVRASNTLL